MRTFFKNLFAATLWFCVFSGCRTPQEQMINIAEYKWAVTLNPESASINIANADFSQGTYGWKMGQDYEIDPNGGMNGSPGLYYERNDLNTYSLCSSNLKVEAGKTYKVGVWARGESLQCGNKPFYCMAIELHKNGKYLTGSYFKPATPLGKDWSYVEGEYISDVSTDASLTLYMYKGVSGKIWFDDVKMECADFDRWIIHQIYPRMSMLFTDDGTASFKVERFSGKRDSNTIAYAELKNAAGLISKATAVPDKNGIIKLSFGKDLAPGKANIHLKVLDTEKKLIVAEKVMPVTICQKQNPGSGICVIDENGRAIVDGKPYLPIGLFTGHLSRKDIKRLALSPFNCLISYSISLKFPDSKKEGLDAVREVLDELAKNNIKVIYSIKDLYDGYPTIDKTWKLYGAQSADESVNIIVNEFKDHPAILAWYVCDELGGNWTERLEKRRYLVNSLDGKHPTWAVYYKFQELPFSSSTCDVMGIDPYPIESPGKHNMELIKIAMTAIARAGNPAVWTVPQIFNRGNYNKLAEDNREFRAKNYADPTEEEMRSMCLLMAMKGAKGFVGYSYFDLFTKDAMPDADKRWPEVCRVGEMLKALAPFLLSEKEAPSITVETKQGEVFAKAFADDKGNVKVLIAGIGPGKAEAVISLPQNINLKSRFGGTKLSSPGRYLFQGNDICSDILE